MHVPVDPVDCMRQYEGSPLMQKHAVESEAVFLFADKEFDCRIIERA